MIKEFQREYRWLSNFWPVTVEYKGRIYPSVEHAYMSAKSNDATWKQLCMDSSMTPGRIKTLSKKLKLVDNWDNIKISVMEECLRDKFRQEPFKKYLLQTGDEYIQEGNMWNDRFWGIDLRTNTGLNHLGRLIMRIRKELKNDAETGKSAQG